MSGFLQLFAAPSRHLFSRPAIRAYYLWVEVLILLLVTSEAIFLTAFFRLRLSGQGVLVASSPVVMLTILWFGILRVHQFAHEAYGSRRDPQNNELNDDLRSGMLLAKLAYLSYAG